MAGAAGDGQETQILDAESPPLGSPFSHSDATQEEEDGGTEDGEEEDGILFGETQPLDVDDTELVEGLEEEAGNVGAGNWGETQLVERSQLVEGCEEDCNGVGEWVETQLVEECEEGKEEGGNDGGDEGDGDWRKTQLIEDSDEETGNGGGDELRGVTQMLSDNEGVCNDGKDVALGMEKRDRKGNAGVVEREGLVDSDASTDEEGGAGYLLKRLTSVRVASLRSCGLAAARKNNFKTVGNVAASTLASVQQTAQQTLTGGTHAFPNNLNNSSSCSTLLHEPSDDEIDNDSHGYIQNHQNDGARSRRSCSTVRKLFADTTPNKDESNTKHVAGLSYIQSQEPGDLSQANALEVVERLISVDDVGSSQEARTSKSEIVKSPSVSGKRGTLMLAEKVHDRSPNGKVEIFDWVNSREDGGGGEFFSKNKDILLNDSKGKSKNHPPKKESTMRIKTIASDKGRDRKEGAKLCGKTTKVPFSDSRLLQSVVTRKKASGNKTKKNLLKELDDMSNAKSLEQQQEEANIATYDVGPDTQMAVEAIEALAYCFPATTSFNGDKTSLDENTRENDNVGRVKRSSKKPALRKRTVGVMQGVTTRSKRRKIAEPTPRTQKEPSRGSKMQERSEEPSEKREKKKKSASKSKIVVQRNDNHIPGTPVALRTRHSRRNDCLEYSDLPSNNRVNNSNDLTNGTTILGGENDHISGEPTDAMCCVTIAGSSLNKVEKEKAVHTSEKNVQNLEPSRDGLRTDVCRDPSPHPKQRRTATKIVSTKANLVNLAVTDGKVPTEVQRPSKKRRVFIRSVSELLQKARREPSNGRASSLLSSLTTRSSLASATLGSSVQIDEKASAGVNGGKKQPKVPSPIERARDSPNNTAEVCGRAMKAPPKVIHEVSPTFTPLNSSKASSRRLSKPSIAKELLLLDAEKPVSYRRLKDSRRRKDITSARVLFSHHLGGDVIKHQKKILARLGVCEASSMSDATHFVADSFFRTKNMLEAIALGKPVVTSMWLENCGQAGCFVDEKKFILRDAKKEKELGFNMPSSLTSACQHPLLQGKRVFTTPNVKPSQELVTSLVLASHGQPIERIGRSIMKEKQVPDDLLVISCEEDYETCVPLLERGAGVFSSEFLLSGIVNQKLEYERHSLFSDHVKQTRSTMWLKDKLGGQFVPVSKCS